MHFFIAKSKIIGFLDQSHFCLLYKKLKNDPNVIDLEKLLDMHL